MSKAKLACKCKSISDSVLGDGCDICNPEKAKDVAYERIADLEQQLAKREADIREMIEKAAAKHRPAYDEQQRKIFGLEQKCEKYHAGKVEMKIKIADLVQQMKDRNGFINDLLSEEKNKWSAGKLLAHIGRVELWRDDAAQEQDNG